MEGSLMIALDSHALLWWTVDPAKLSAAASAACATIVTDGGIVSSISVWEIGMKVKKGVLDVGMTMGAYVQRLKQIPGLAIIPVDEAIWLENLALAWKHADPADR